MARRLRRAFACRQRVRLGDHLRGWAPERGKKRRERVDATFSGKPRKARSPNAWLRKTGRQRSPSDGQASVKLWKTETLGKPGRSTPMRRPSPGVHTPQIHEEATGEKRRVSVQREAARWTARKGEVFAEERLSQARRGRLREGSERGSRVEEREGNERKKEKV
ncbi:hypothetical protein TGPRC2_236830 [Toxoplasma gondii TgCatPRC2]|uniref:Uncharacterized protein n=5 Tax=Toxoplasma gondii TaxID=5811 RepID=A0A151HEU4_TOXGO|nr:hypothetical protein TGME49_236830 [Toxoplasma gondii ME49]KFG31773.1 hypothetical protein TGDOM2_236830 [Toxoplasma gondii GAB2-2007-GAL-DOM2]KYF43036.1 hypothetical protein TGARI_236830 [Toxoplasma gondii ARI]KYK67826.1 hypothetical protein TGPRC2_236830 [Toxoplasma gondii TgCatPRC2]PIL99374.1 hypothetical protein TGCOUG_236830 [Toxoplasma gondii COUG]EPT26645.1 hypothetical protein TGME49_236830 [Toxoplasma gondii ME49]|eukprot:XP_002369035.1 hypothetical protein TGME49_236830 [Toxoplasma gondii ME49]